MNNQEQFIIANETASLREQLAAAQERDWTGSLIDRLNEFARENSGEYSEVRNGRDASAMIQAIHGNYNHIRIQLSAEKARADKAEAACAEMRPLLSSWAKDGRELYDRGGVSYNLITNTEHALSADCGHGWLSPEKAKVAREALEHIKEYWNGSPDSAVDAIESAIEQANCALDVMKE